MPEQWTRYQRRRPKPNWQCRIGWHRWYLASAMRSVLEWRVYRCERCFKTREEYRRKET